MTSVFALKFLVFIFFSGFGMGAAAVLGFGSVMIRYVTSTNIRDASEAIAEKAMDEARAKPKVVRCD